MKPWRPGVLALLAFALSCHRGAHSRLRTSSVTTSERTTLPLTAPVAPAWTADFHLRNRAFTFTDLPDVVVHAPAGFDARQPLHLVVFLHGMWTYASQWVASGQFDLRPGQRVWGWGLGARHDLAGTNSLLIVPQFPLNATRGWTGHFGQPGFFERFITELLGESLVDRIGRHGYDDVADVTLVASSAGGAVVTELLALHELDDRIRAIVIYDGLYGGEDRIARWILSAHRDRPRRFVDVDAGTRYTLRQVHALVASVTPRLGAALVDPPGGSLTDAVRGHTAVIDTVHCDHAMMPVAFFDKVLAGLDLPLRSANATPDPKTPRAGTLPPATPLQVGSVVTGALAADGPQLGDGSLFIDYSIELAGGRAVTIDLRGGRAQRCACASLDVEARVLDGERVVATDDDSGGGLNSRVLFTPPRAGRYTVRVTTHGPWVNAGAYTLRVTAVHPS